LRHAFFFGPISVTIFNIIEPSDSPDAKEIGCRVEIQRYYEELPGSLWYAVPVVTLREPIWRCDIQRRVPAKDGDDQRAHVHTKWTGQLAVEREFDPELTRDPLGWVEKQLGDLRGVLRAGGAEDLVEKLDYGELDAALPLLMATIRSSMQPPHARATPC
jgi:hypothetical protein